MSPGYTISYSILLDTILHLFNVATGTANSDDAVFNLDALHREFNSTPFHSARIFKLDIVCAIIELLISFVYQHFSSIEVLILIILSTCDN